MPKDTVTFVVMVHDMDPRVNKANNDTMHWMVWNIPANVTQLPEGVSPAQLPEGAVQLSNNNRTGYLPFCMPLGAQHHYLFEVYAIDQKLDLPATADRFDVAKAIDGHILDHGVLIGHWHRPLP